MRDEESRRAINEQKNSVVMKSKTISFENELFTKTRIIEINGELHFVAKDVAENLEYVWNGIVAVKHVPEEWRGVRSVLTPSGIQEVITLSEQGLYFFLGRSDKSKALPFQKWIAGEILPSLRKTGSYQLGKKHPRRKGNEEEIMQMLRIIDMHLVRGDKTRIAEELGVNRLSVMYVLSGRIRSERILRALYEKALKNKHKSLYAYPKIAIEKLGGKTNE